MFLLDTNVISELGRPSGKADSKVAAWSARTPQPVLHFSVVTILEIEMGILGLEHRNDHVQAARLRAWAMSSSRSQAGSSRSTACGPNAPRAVMRTALTHDLTVATWSVADFGPMGAVPIARRLAGLFPLAADALRRGARDVEGR